MIGVFAFLQARAASIAQQATNANQTSSEGQPMPTHPAAAPAQTLQMAEQKGAAQEEPATDHGSASGAAGAKAEKKKKRKTASKPAAELGSTAQDTNGAAAPEKGMAADQPDAQPGKGKRQKIDAHEAEHANGLDTPSANGATAGVSQQVEKGEAFQWKKLAAQVLNAKGPGHRMKLRKLQLKVLSAAGLAAGNLDRHGDEMIRRWSKSGKFVVEDGFVMLKQQLSV